MSIRNFWSNKFFYFQKQNNPYDHDIDQFNIWGYALTKEVSFRIEAYQPVNLAPKAYRISDKIDMSSFISYRHNK